MGLLESLKKRILGGRDTPDVDEEEQKLREQMGVQPEVLQDGYDQLSPQQIEEVFRAMAHERRLAQVRHHCISRLKWRETTGYIRGENPMRNTWGLEESLIKITAKQAKRCQNHDTIVERRQLVDKQQTQSARSQRHSEQLGADVTGDAQVAQGAVSGSDTTSNQASSSLGTVIGGSRTILECGTGDKDCKINRRSFIKAGDYHMTSGQPQTSKLEDEFRRAVEEAGVDS